MYTCAEYDFTLGHLSAVVLRQDFRKGPCEEDGSYFLDRDGLQFLFIMKLGTDCKSLRASNELFY